MWPIVKIFWMLNWWIGSIGGISRDVPGRAGLNKATARSSTRRSVGNGARRPHHVDHPGGKAEQEEHDKAPGRGRQQAIESPADPRADDDAGDQFGRKAETARESRGSGCSVSAPLAGLTSPDVAV